MGAFDIDYPRAVLVSLVAVILIALVVAGSTSGAAFGVYNTDWEGASTVHSVAEEAGTDVSVIRNTDQFSETPAAGTIAMVLAPDDPYTQSEAAQVRQFVERGGTLLVAEDYGPHSNDLLETVGASARIDGRPVRDPQNNYRSGALPVATNVSGHSLTAGVESLTLNHGTVVRPNDATVLVNTSTVAYLDANRNGALDDSESVEQYPVITVESVGNGHVIVVSDPSLFINAMVDLSDNRAFISNHATEHDRVLLDQSHVATLPPLVLALAVLRESPFLQVLLGLVPLGVITFWAYRPEFVTRIRERLSRERPSVERTLSPDEMETAIAERHPDWDEARVRRVVRTVVEDEHSADGDET